MLFVTLGCVYSGSIAAEQIFEPCADNKSVNTSSVSSEKGDLAADLESSCVSSDVTWSVGTDDHAETNRAADNHKIVKKTAADNDGGGDVYRVRRRRTANSNCKVNKICEVCGKTFRHYESFRSHKRKHAEEVTPGTQSRLRIQQSKTPLRLMCEICGLRGKNCAAFGRHMRTYHPSAMDIDNSGAPYPCKLCDEKFFQRRILSHHVRLLHAGNLPRIKTSWFRRRRRLRGSGMPYCRYCYRCCGSRLALEAHERVHTGLKPYQCQECGRSFRQMIHLTTHRRTHTKERPFVCSVCQKAYKNRVDLRKHCSKIHGISLPVKRQCGVGGIDVVAAAVAAADIGPDDDDDISIGPASSQHMLSAHQLC